jgi:hypothetical protein
MRFSPPTKHLLATTRPLWSFPRRFRVASTTVTSVILAGFLEGDHGWTLDWLDDETLALRLPILIRKPRLVHFPLLAKLSHNNHHHHHGFHERSAACLSSRTSIPLRWQS